MPTAAGKTKLHRIWTLYMPLALCMSFTLFPLYWILMTSLKSNREIIASPITYVPSLWSFDHYRNAWSNVGFAGYFANSLLVAGGTVVLVLGFATLVGYALSRFGFRGKGGFMLLLLSTQFIPHALLLIPLYLIFQSVGMTSNLFALVLTYTTFQLPFNAILMSGFIANIPQEIEEAAMIDGCSRLKSVAYVIVPLLLPGIVATSAFTFVGAWNEFLFALMMINKNNLFTVPVGLSFMMGEFTIDYGTLAAGGVIAMLPTVALFMYIQRYLVNGLSAGAVKG